MSERHGSGYWGARKISRRRVLGGATLGLVGIGLGACTPTATPTSVAVPTTAPVAAASVSPAAGAAVVASPAAAPKRGGTLGTMVTITERTLDPHAPAGAFGGVGNDVCYSQLLAYKWGPGFNPPSYIPGPDLAESWTQPDDLTYIFKLRQGVRWHNIAPVNGRELVADDIIFSFQRIIDLKFNAGFFAGVAKMEAPDKSTVKITLSKPNADFLVTMCEPAGTQIVAKEVVDQNSNLEKPPVIGTGAWIFEAWDPNQRITAVRNPDYFLKGLPYADRWESYRAGDPSAVLNAFRSDSVNVVGSGMYGQSGEDLLKAVPKATTYWVLLDRNPSEMKLNTKEDIFKDIRVRQAISKAIDRRSIIDSIFLGHAVLSSSIIVPAPDYRLPASELSQIYARDVEGAKKLLSDAGKSAGLAFEALVPTYLQGAYTAMAEVIQANLKEVGINMTIVSVDTPTLLTRQASGNFQAQIAAGGGYGAPNALFNSIYHSNAPQNYCGFNSPDIEKLMDQQAVLVKDPNMRKQLLLDIQRRIINEFVYMNLHDYQQPTMAQTEIHDFYPPTGTNSDNLFWTTMWVSK
jgi:peptide/nickel transport system substrate-binding protein